MDDVEDVGSDGFLDPMIQESIVPFVEVGVRDG
jgi:hypothetical protein